ncbi:MAG: DUF6883 domain-containing protein [Pseudomonadota bacterium]
MNQTNQTNQRMRELDELIDRNIAADMLVYRPEEFEERVQSHLIGRWKARFFLSIGFRETRVDELKDALMDVAKKGQVKSTITTEFGIKYVVEGVILGPSGRRSVIRTKGVLCARTKRTKRTR